MNLKNFDDEQYYRRNTMKSKKNRKDDREVLKEPDMPKSKPKMGDYHLVARRTKIQNRSDWYSNLDSS